MEREDFVNELSLDSLIEESKKISKLSYQDLNALMITAGLKITKFAASNQSIPSQVLQIYQEISELVDQRKQISKTEIEVSAQQQEASFSSAFMSSDNEASSEHFENRGEEVPLN